jgi:hypothetical protein
MKKFLKIIAQIFFWFFLIIFQVSFISSLSYPFYNLPVFLVVLSFFLIFNKGSYVLIILVFSGFLLDSFFFYQFGLFLMSLLISFFILKFIQTNFLTNRSFYSVIILSLLFIVFFNLIFNLIDFFLYLFSLDNNFFLFKLSFWQDFFYQVLFGLILSIIFFYVISSKSKNLRSNFLEQT